LRQAGASIRAGSDMPDNPRARPVSLARKIAQAKEQIAYYRTTETHDPEIQGRLDLWIARLQDLEQRRKKVCPSNATRSRADQWAELSSAT
jgi:hypothetical protein